MLRIPKIGVHVFFFFEKSGIRQMKIYVSIFIPKKTFAWNSTD